MLQGAYTSLRQLVKACNYSTCPESYAPPGHLCTYFPSWSKPPSKHMLISACTAPWPSPVPTQHCFPPQSGSMPIKSPILHLPSCVTSSISTSPLLIQGPCCHLHLPGNEQSHPILGLSLALHPMVHPLAMCLCAWPGSEVTQVSTLAALQLLLVFLSGAGKSWVGRGIKSQ